MGSKVTTDHEEIRRWAEERGGRPARVKGTGRGDAGILRIDFPGYSGEGTLEHISWDDWFDTFDKSNLAFIYQETTADGRLSRFNKLVHRDTVGLEETEQAEEEEETGRGERAQATARSEAASESAEGAEEEPEVEIEYVGGEVAPGAEVVAEPDAEVLADVTEGEEEGGAATTAQRKGEGESRVAAAEREAETRGEAESTERKEAEQAPASQSRPSTRKAPQKKRYRKAG